MRRTAPRLVFHRGRLVPEGLFRPTAFDPPGTCGTCGGSGWVVEEMGDDKAGQTFPCWRCRPEEKGLGAMGHDAT